MIDAHCHLCDEQFDQDLDNVVANAKSADVLACLVNTENVSEFDKCIRYAGFFVPCFGVHPVQYDSTPEYGGRSARSAKMDDLIGFDDYVSKFNDKLVAIGEVGLDFTPRYISNDQDKAVQRMVLKHQIEVAQKYDLPIIAHSRSAGRPVIEFLIENGAKKVLLHAFSGNLKSARAGIEAGYYFSVPPCVIRSDQKKSLFSEIPMQQILLETDSPVLGPTKEERNEPSNIGHSVEFLSSVKKIDVELVKKLTVENTHRLFARLKSLI